jgi:hypothetical protein
MDYNDFLPEKYSGMFSDTEIHYGMMLVPNLWLTCPDLETGDQERLTFWEYEDLALVYCQKKVSEYLDTVEEI